jgi:hypothetical protein
VKDSATATKAKLLPINDRSKISTKLNLCSINSNYGRNRTCRNNTSNEGAPYHAPTTAATETGLIGSTAATAETPPATALSETATEATTAATAEAPTAVATKETVVKRRH